MYSLLLYERLAEDNDGYITSLTHHARDWQRSTRAVGGYWTGDFTATAETMDRTVMVDLFSHSIGQRVVEKCYGLTSWEGEIVEMRLMLDGTEYTITLDPEHWHNRVKVQFGADYTEWTENTDATGLYGDSEYIDLVGTNYDITSAEAARDRRLIQFAYPRSRATGGLSRRDSVMEDNSLRVTCAGYVFGMNRRYQEDNIDAADVSTQISTLVGNSEFVTAGRIEENTLQAKVEVSGVPLRLWDNVEDLIEMGDDSGNQWVGGVYAGREFLYEQAQTAVTHYWRNGRLVDVGGVEVPPPLIVPNILVQQANAPGGVTPVGGSDFDNPKLAWIEEVEFVAPDRYRLIPRGGF